MLGLNKREERKKKAQEKLLTALQNAPVRIGFTARELSKAIDMPEPTARVHLELLEETNKVQSYYIGKSRIYKKSTK